ncbi:FAD-binding oxidoreductase [Mesorhizobium sp. M1C.F.Ca.ET.193.01.1.1]|nr:FAD-binding oxidoreductase [Mesorhizobium sp. M1C.F.Ca.ET.210.01.1.1]TGQ70822.1 FAD-binding oxidoreductase [Mesorhizobium sp. M1C.F.Ca.ET.212.01.1.1]TGR07398.1 FAD-binding oxidoreductase [Mesorhizobium sp. M1C.F.Ca.ET.204.01.1.1]TGR28270.1 FAD-binding oxidoreductase [Mesorhizobium sp. M1C.F.Ca.ET.196.01.1.1]TGR51117.1 FAD-binding oxidoreductase [Mesorhizobium sp. M1C.F.Ca.ET.195.01.1.1]TGR65037.1 FAD-binding oxidoreductase [Mesorhizobium sp. M1C.F.Ca.ET.192.01.1.1]TGR79755.1 FAD-binding ox
MTDPVTTLRQILGPKGWLSGPDAEPYQRDWLNRYGVRPLGVARPSNTAEVAALVKACREAGLDVVPQGGNTGLCGGAVAQQPNAVIVSLSRMAAIGEPDPDGGSILVEAGVVLAALHEALEPHGLMFPMHLGAEGSARIGGLIGTNAGGSQAFRFGMMQDLVLGLEVVTPDGAIWDGLRAVQKDNAGYQLRKLYCGAEGTLGIVTRAVLRLYPTPRQQAGALLVMSDFTAAVSFGAYLRGEAGEFLAGLEFFSDIGLALALKHLPDLAYQLETRGEVYLLVELASGSTRVPLDDILASALEWGMEQGLVVDGALATSGAQRAQFWRLREEQPEGQRLEGEQLKHDISVPPGAIARFIEVGAKICDDILPGVRINPFGHLGDGNIHYNLSPPENRADFDGKAGRFAEALASLATEMGGSFAAEHGLGRAKIVMAERNRSIVERELMARLKDALDPHGTMNPGVLVRSPL